MKCDVCGRELFIAKARYTSKKDSEEVYSELDLACINPSCKNYAGEDTSKPKKIAKTEKRKVN